MYSKSVASIEFSEYRLITLFYQVRVDKTSINGLIFSHLMDGWITCHFTSFSTAFQSYQINGQMIMEGCVQWNPFMVEKNLPRGGLQLGTARSAGQRLTH